MRIATSLLVLTLFAGCNNPCQRVCLRMQTFAEDCGYTVPDAELDACLDETATSSADDKATCREFGDLGTIERTWDCDVAAQYWGTPTTGS